MTSPNERGATRVTTGILDLSAMNSCNIDAHELLVAPDHLSAAPNAADDFRGTLRLPPGAMTTGNAVVGASTNNGFGLLVLSNTVFTVTNSLAVNATAIITNSTGAVSSGIDITRADAGAFTVEAGAVITLTFLEPAASLPHHALRWAGNHVAELEAMVSDGRIVIDDAGLGKTASVYLKSGDSYVGLPPPAGTMFTIR